MLHLRIFITSATCLYGQAQLTKIAELVCTTALTGIVSVRFAHKNLKKQKSFIWR